MLGFAFSLGQKQVLDVGFSSFRHILCLYSTTAMSYGIWKIISEDVNQLRIVSRDLFCELHDSRFFRAQADWILTRTSHKTEQSTIEASVTLDCITRADSLLRWSLNEWPSVCKEIPLPGGKMFWMSNKPSQLTHYILDFTETKFIDK
jgi:hypothetical protein